MDVTRWARVLGDLIGRVAPLLTSSRASTKTASSGTPRPSARPKPPQGSDTVETIEIAPPSATGLTLSYAPEPDGDPDAGEVVWTWVPYAENDGRGKDRPVLIIGQQRDGRVYAVRLTSKSHEGDRDFLSIGSGPWDSQGRPSWVDIDQLYSVHPQGMRREASELDEQRYATVAAALTKRYGWKYERTTGR